MSYDDNIDFSREHPNYMSYTSLQISFMCNGIYPMPDFFSYSNYLNNIKLINYKKLTF